MKLLRSLSLIFLITFPIMGCGKTNAPITVHPVSGRIFYAGQPAAGVQVYFVPTTAPAMPLIPSNPRGVTEADGRFTLTTFTESDGAAIGLYQVILIWPPAKKSARSEDDEDRLLGWYGGVHSKFTAEVKEGANTLPPIRLDAVFQPPEQLQGIPGKN